MNGKRLSILIAAALIGAISAGVPAAHGQQAANDRLEQGQLVRAQKIIGKSIDNEERSDGRLMDIIIDSNQGKIAYWVVRWGFGAETYFALPFQTLTEKDGKLAASLKRTELDKAHSFQKENYPDMSSLEWARGVHSRHNATPYWQNQTNANGQRVSGQPQINAQNPWVNRVNEIIGKPVAGTENNQGQLGTVTDLVLDIRLGHVVYAVVSTAGANNELALVPWSAMKVNPQQKRFELNATAQTLRTAAFRENNWPKMTDEQWARDLHQRYQATPYWNVYGFADADQADDAWRKGSQYNTLFNPNRTQTVRGEVTQVSTFTPEGTKVQGRQITLKDQAGRSHVVHLGPVDFVDRTNPDLRIGQGDDVTVIGSLVRFKGDQVLIASRISKGNETLELRNAQGSPKWETVGAGNAPAAPATVTDSPEISAAEQDKKVQEGVFVQSHRLIGQDIRDAQGDVAGQLMDLIIDSNQGEIAYGIVRLGNWGFGANDLYAVPFELLKPQDNKERLVARMTKEQIRASRSFERNQYPNMSDPTWATEVHQRFGVTPYWQDTNTVAQDREQKRGRDSELVRNPQISAEDPWMNRVTEMDRKLVRGKSADAQGRYATLGTVRDVVLDLKHGHVVYVTIYPSGTDKKLALIPWSAMEPNPAEDQFHVAIDLPTLQQAAFDQDTFPKMNDPQWARVTHDRFNKTPYWQVFGFGGETSWDEVWRAGSNYNKLFDQSKTQTVRGTVTNIGTFSPGANSARGRQITLRANDGQTYTIHLGPADYIDRDNTKFRIREGDELSVNASAAQFEGKDVLIASRVRKGGESLDLRNFRGRPRWDLGSDDQQRD